LNSLNDINWNHLYYFYETARVQSLKKAAKGIGISPSTLSEQIKKFEEKLHKKLFNRSSKGLQLTQDGLQVFERTKSIFEEGSKLLEEFSDNTVGGYPVTIGIEETISNDLATEFCSQYWDLYTMFGTVNTVRQVEHNILIDNIINGNIDWGISIRKPKRRGLSFEEIGSFEIVFCCSKDLYKKFKSNKDLLINIPFAETHSDENINKAVLKHLRKNGITPKEKIYSDHHDFVKNLCLRGRCVTFLPKNPLEDYSDLQIFKINAEIRVSLYAIWQKKDEGLVSISKLKELINSNISKLPETYTDTDFQIEISEVPDDLLNE